MQTETLFDVQDEQEVLIRATVERVFYAEKGRVIARVFIDQDTRPTIKRTRIATLSVLGPMTDITPGQQYEFTGRLEYNDRFNNWNLHFHTYRTILPTNADAILRYLVDVAKWVGPKTSKDLVDAYGPDTLQVIKNDPDRVAREIDGVTQTRAIEMKDSLECNEKMEAATIEINAMIGGCLPASVARKAIQKWGMDAPAVIKENPYELTKLYGVGFLSADAVHSRIGGDKNDIKRHTAAVIHSAWESASRDGHTALTQMELTSMVNKLVSKTRDDAITTCIKDESLRQFGDTLQLTELHRAERYLAGKIATLQSTLDDSANDVFDIPTDGLSQDQIEAVTSFGKSQVFILTGAPGTGKTYTVARIVKSAQDAHLTVALAAPTGKAAKQMEQALSGICSGSASTIHSLLAPSIDEETGEFSFQKNEADPIDIDLLVIDEFSMVDTNLAFSLLRAVRPTTRLLIVGDHYQLPSVGPGAILRDLLDAGVPSYELRTIKRNAGTIVRLCHAIKDGKMIDPPERLALESGDNWRHLETTDPAGTKSVIERLLKHSLPEIGLNLYWDVQAVSPTNEKGALSCEKINRLYKSIVNPVPPPFTTLPFAVGDKVVRTKNAVVPGKNGHGYQLQDFTDTDKIRVVNGDIGVITHIDKKTILVEFRYPDRHAKLTKTDHNLKLAYCLTCHKMQGSESPVVILPLDRKFRHIPMVNREWIYTAVSRAKQFIVTIGDIGVLSPIVSKIGAKTRQTMLVKEFERTVEC